MGSGVEQEGSESTTTGDGPATAIAAWMLVACLAMAVLESVLARRFSHARPSGSGPVHATVRIAAGRAA
jgi:hypothetical protein